MKSKSKTKAKSKAKTRTRPGTGAKPKVSKKQQRKKIIITSLAVGAAGILGFFGWQYWKKKKQANGVDFDAVLKENNNIITSPVDFSQTYTSPKPAKSAATPFYNSKEVSEFPLKKGGKGNLVRQLQEALIDKYGKSILPKYGADGDFGSETANALKKAGLPASIDQSTFNVIVGATKIDSATVGKEMYAATIAKDFNKLLSSLKKLKSTDDYSGANEVFKTYRINGVRQTIVNGLLNIFSKADQKEKIKFEFLRMGLQYDGSKWSLSGLDGLPLITTEPTTVWANAKEGVKVPGRMVLGNEVSRRLDYTLFENKGKYFLVNTRSVKYL